MKSFSRRNIAVVAALLLVANLAVAVLRFWAAEDLVLPGGAVIGGDFTAFYAASKAMLGGQAAETYDASLFVSKIQEFTPVNAPVGLTWQYPPTYFLAIAPLGLLDYLSAYVLFAFGAAALFFGVVRGRLPPFFLFVVAASPSAFHAIVTGQNGFLTAALLAAAALYPDKRPIVAGLAAALLTMKPQLGLLIPIAYAAAGCWRAFGIATGGALLLGAASIGIFGADIWIAFLGGVAHAGDNLSSGLMPLFKMTTPFAAARFAGLPEIAALCIHGLFTLAAAAFVATVWRRVPDWDLRAAALCSAVFFAAPYGFYYELIILALPVMILARRALASGWLKWEQPLLALIFLLPMQIPGMAMRQGLSIGFIVVVLTAVCVWRRIATEQPQALVRPGAAFSWLQRAFLHRDNPALRRPEPPATGA